MKIKANIAVLFLIISLMKLKGIKKYVNQIYWLTQFIGISVTMEL